MYTLVLMSALAGGPDATRFDGGGGGCHGSACYSACYGTSCVGSSYASCYGGCHGGPLFPRARALFAGVGDGLRGAFAPPGTYRSFGCCGGYASCHGCGGGYASCHGCFGGASAGCFGGASYGSAVYGGCYGTSYGSAVFAGGNAGCYGFAANLQGIPAVPMTMSDAMATTVAYKPVADTTAASLVIALPAAARLYVDGQLVAGDGPARRFHTPPLTAGQTFYYELKAEVLVGGRVEVEEAKVVIRAGDNKDVAFPKLVAAVAQADASLAAR